MKTVGLVWRTVRHLTWRQVFFQLLHRLRGRGRLRLPKTAPVGYFLVVPDPEKSVSWQAGTFTFLNRSASFGSTTDWNYTPFGKLWAYNLHYFDFLNQPEMSVAQGLALIQDFMRQTDAVRIGLEPYPTSVRILNWVQFLSRHQLQDLAINQHLYAQVGLLTRRLEHHLSGNHLLENGFALLTGALFFRQERWYLTAARLLRRELTNQVLADGGHYERSPMYHQLLLDRLLDAVLLLQNDSWGSDPELELFLTRKAGLMLSWLRAITFRNGDVPLFNDAALGIAPSTDQLLKKADSILPQKRVPDTVLTTSGYRMFRRSRYELLATVGAPGPVHQPGHAHADTLSFVLQVNNQPVLVDTGTSTYELGPRRTWERSTEAHNTVTINGANSSEVWAGFRMGRRARVSIRSETDSTLTACHDGYRSLNLLHERTWSMEADAVILMDRLLNHSSGTGAGQAGVARFYFHPGLTLHTTEKGVQTNLLEIRVRSATKPELHVKDYALANGFNQLVTGQCLEVSFTDYLESTLTFPE